MSASQNSQKTINRLIPLAVFLFFSAGLVVILSLTGRNPSVESVRPTVAREGERVEITGRLFGDVPGSVRLAGQRVPSSSVIEWTDSRIVLSVPSGTVSGMLFVETDGGTSAGTLLQMRSSVPRSADVSERPGSPRIERLETTESQIGSLLTIRGENFGNNRRDSVVLFPSLSDDRLIDPQPASFSYPEWTDTAIRVRVPSEAISGFVVVRTAWGTSNPMRLQIERPAGALVRTDRTEIAVQYGASVANTELRDSEPLGAGARDLVVWLPAASSGFAQSNIRYIRGHESETVTVPGGRVYRSRYENVPDEFGTEHTLIVVVDRYGIGIDIDTSRLSPVYDGESGFFEYFTRPTAELPRDDAEFVELAAEIRRGRASPYVIARAAYDWTLDHMTYATGEVPRDARTGLSRGTGDDVTYALVLVTLLRSARIPSRVVSGVVASGFEDLYAHSWAEFFVPSIGWVPADPSFGDGAFPAGFAEPADPAEFYFAGLDSARVAFSRGELQNGPEHRDGSDYAPDDPLASQRRFVETGPAIARTDGQWSEPRLLAFRSWSSAALPAD